MGKTFSSNKCTVHCQNQKISSCAVSKSKSESGGLMYVHIKSHSVHYRVAGFFLSQTTETPGSPAAKHLKAIRKLEKTYP